MMSERTQAISGFFARGIEQNPLALGLVAFAAGAALGLLIPETRKENELMGGQKDLLLQKAQTAVKDLSGKVGTVAGTAQAAAEEALDKTKNAALDAVHDAVDAVKEEAEHQGLPAGA
jgi:hypothetical protein